MFFIQFVFIVANISRVKIFNYYTENRICKCIKKYNLSIY